MHAEEAAEAASPSKAPVEAEHGAQAPPAHAAFESVHEQLAASQHRQQSVKAGLQGLHRQLADQQAKLGALQGHLKLLEESSKPLQQQLAQQQAAIAALQESAGAQRAMEALQKQAAQQQAELATLQEAVASASLPELRRQLLAAQEQLQGLQQQFQSLSSSGAHAGLPEEVEVRINKVELTAAGEKMRASFAAVAAHLVPSATPRHAWARGVQGRADSNSCPGHKPAHLRQLHQVCWPLPMRRRIVYDTPTLSGEPCALNVRHVHRSLPCRFANKGAHSDVSVCTSA